MNQKLNAITLAAIMVFSVFTVASIAAVPAAANHAANDVLTVDGDGSQDGHYATIQSAVDNASPDDTVSVNEGTYEIDGDRVAIDTPDVTIESTGDRSDTVIRVKHDDKNPGYPVIDVLSDGVTVRGLTLERVMTGENSGSERFGQGVKVGGFGASGGSAGVVTNNTIRLVDESGGSTDHNTMLGVAVLAPGDGSGNTNNVEVSENAIEGFDYEYDGSLDDTGVLVNSGTGHIVDGNDLSGNGVQYRDTTGNTDVNSVYDNNSFDQSVTIDRAGDTLGTIWSSVQDSVGTAEIDDVVEVGPGTYNEGVEIDTEGLTLESKNGAGSTTISADATEGVMIRSSGVTVRGFTVTTNTADGTHGQYGIRLEPDAAVSDILIEDNVVEDIIDPYRPSGISLDMKGTADAEATNVTVRGNTIRNIKSSESQWDAVSKGINPNERIVGLTIESNTIENIGGQDDAGATGIDFSSDTGPSTNVGPTDFEIVNNTISDIEIGTAGPEVWMDHLALYFHAYGDLGDHSVRYNNITDGTVRYNTDGVSNPDTLDATLNWWGDDRDDGASIDGDVAYDPFLTAPKDDVEQNPVDTQQYGHDVTVPHDGDMHAVGIPGAVESVQVSGLGSGEIVWAYNASTGEWTQWTPGDSVDPHDALIVSTDASHSGDVRFVVDFADSSGSVSAPAADDLAQGWNLVSAPQYGTVSSVYNLGSGELNQIQHVYAQPASQPYTPGDSMFTVGPDSSNRLSAFAGYWVYVNSDSTVPVAVPQGVTAGTESGYIEP